ncbi:RNA polymerase sigma-70 factor (ECF subfamily) [Friedmanniella endophytica]|uniref:RNA polymerase sigma factor n=1 Tax=Microlunatus kandeliicorticis TaxID=1759536 RepID=A0A7W3IVG2_9ACTN|nr:RNA polymerase sigma factor [Microlunatus kandeliicorticis]MBA8795920.1 RNA polymerase sigma-70 factor (ECF subfamily) [Microlunatus kandeliicorticis]
MTVSPSGHGADESRGTQERTGDDGAAQLREATVVGRAQDGDVDAFEQLARSYQGPLFRLAYRLLGDRGEAEDVLQDALVQAWRRLPILTDPEAFHSWIYQIVTRRCLSVLRTRGRRRTDPAEGDELAEVLGDRAALFGSRDDDPASAAELSAQLRGLSDLLAGLPEDQRICWVLHELHELTYPEIAYAMNLPLSTVRGRIARARQNLTKGMDSWR